MATLDDKLLGEKTHYYCSSSEDEHDDDEKVRGGSKPSNFTLRDGSNFPSVSPPAILSPGDSATNTGPKGVLNDWKRYQELKQQKEREADVERLKVMEKLSMSCKPFLKEMEEKKKQEQMEEELDKLLTDEDPFLNEYMKKRLQEMMEEVRLNRNGKRFGELSRLRSGEEFLNAIEKEDKDVLVIVHISNDDVEACIAMNGCLSCLAPQYPFIKFCSLNAHAAGMSERFEKHGVPALLIYKNGHLVGNFVRLTDEFGEDYFATEVEAFLIDHGFLPDKNLVPELIQVGNITEGKIKCGKESDDDDS